jgi:hypothetical protein
VTLGDVVFQARPKKRSKYAFNAACVNALHESHLVDAYPMSWPDDPVAWLNSGQLLGGCGGFVRHRLLASSDTAGHVSVPRMLVCVDTASAPDGCQVVRCFVAWARR